MPITGRGGRPNKLKRDARLDSISQVYILALSDTNYDELVKAINGDSYDSAVKTIASLKIWEYIMGKTEAWANEVRGV